MLAKAVPEKSKKLAMGLLMHMTINLTYKLHHQLNTAAMEKYPALFAAV